jgi:hypothetical protein
MSKLVTALRRPSYVTRRVRELGVGRFASEAFAKRLGLPVNWVGPTVRAARILGNARDYGQRRRLARELAATTGNPLAIPEDLGYRRVEGRELPGHEAALRRCQRVLAERGSLLERFPDQYGINLLAEDGLTWSKHPLDLRPYDDLLDLAVDPRLVAAAARYLGEVPALTSIQIYCTTDRQSFGGNNYYHFGKDNRQVKFWMAINEIVDETGPFTCIDATRSKRVRARAGYHGRLPDERVYAAVPEADRIEFKGPPGSMMLVDTCRCVHFGSRTRKGPRVMLLIQYQSAYPWFENVFYFQPVLYNVDRYRNDPLARLVLAQLREKVVGKR